MLIFGYFMDDFPKSMQAQVYNLHKCTGFFILMLALLWSCWTLANPKPRLDARTSWLERLLAKAVHASLYLFAIGMPLVGWIGASASGRPPHVGALDLAFPMTLPHDKGFISTTFDLHNTFAIVLIVLVSVHVLAALFHHFIRKDNILVRMLP
jgi:cytochrome b561